MDAHFTGLAVPDALHRLLDGLDFALLPQTRGPSKLFVYARDVGDATEHVVARGGRPRPGDVVPNELVVVMKPGARGRLARLARRLGAEVVGTIDALGAYRLRLRDADATRAARDRLAHDADVDTVEPNRVVGVPAVIEPAAETPATALDVHPSPSGDRVIVGLIDTAVQPAAADVGAFLAPGTSIGAAVDPPADTATHGTMVARTILDGVATALHEAGAGQSVPLSIVPIDVYGADENTDTFRVAQGLDAAFGRHVNVVNLSLGGADDSTIVQRLIQTGRDAGVLFFAAAGNEPTTQPYYPAADAGVVSVTAADAQGNVAPYANRGTWVDAMAPGTDVVQLGSQAWLGTGTSISTARVTGWAAASLASTPGATTTRVEQLTLGRWGVAGRK